MSTSTSHMPRDVTLPLTLAFGLVVIFLGVVVAWSLYAPLATTLHVSGKIVSSQPTFELQHPYGGEIRSVQVQKHSVVRAGDLLFELDDRLDRAALMALLENRARVQSENAAIALLLDDGAAAADLSNVGAAGALRLRHEQTSLQHVIKVETARSLRQQADALDGKIAVARTQLALMQDRAERQTQLSEQGLLPRSEVEAVEERLFIVRGEIQSDLASLYALEDQARQTQEQAELVLISLHSELAAKREANLRALEDMTPQIVELEDRIAKSVVRAPTAGTVTELHYAAEDMFAARGSTLVTLAKPLEHPHISFSIPTGQIDQLSLGMTGHLTIASLPQRSMPKVAVTVTAISPRARHDDSGQPVAYEGRAELDTEAMSVIREALGDISLTEDMPVTLTLEARETTLADYVVSPFLSAFQNALQD